VGHHDQVPWFSSPDALEFQSVAGEFLASDPVSNAALLTETGLPRGAAYTAGRAAPRLVDRRQRVVGGAFVQAPGRSMESRSR
jgi:hypothetical protein